MKVGDCYKINCVLHLKFLNVAQRFQTDSLSFDRLFTNIGTSEKQPFLTGNLQCILPCGYEMHLVFNIAIRAGPFLT